ncbi:hypothetical protein N9004_02235 [Pirellulales bacterium]|nr:hypothetical protein [Pirellulales bacterium]
MHRIVERGGAVADAWLTVAQCIATAGNCYRRELLPQGIATAERPMSQAKARYAEWRHVAQNIERF